MGGFYDRLIPRDSLLPGMAKAGIHRKWIDSCGLLQSKNFIFMEQCHGRLTEASQQGCAGNGSKRFRTRSHWTAVARRKKCQEQMALSGKQWSNEGQVL